MARSIEKSWALFRDSSEHLACGSSTLSKVPLLADDKAVEVRALPLP